MQNCQLIAIINTEIQGVLLPRALPAGVMYAAVYMNTIFVADF